MGRICSLCLHNWRCWTPLESKLIAWSWWAQTILSFLSPLNESLQNDYHTWIIDPEDHWKLVTYKWWSTLNAVMLWIHGFGGYAFFHSALLHVSNQIWCVFISTCFRAWIQGHTPLNISKLMLWLWWAKQCWFYVRCKEPHQNGCHK